MNEQIKFYKGLESNLPTSEIEIGALYHCTDTKNTYIGISATKLQIFSTGIIIYSGTEEPDSSLGSNGDIYIKLE